MAKVHVIRFRVTSVELEKAKAYAARSGKNMSEISRELWLQAIKRS